MPRSTPGEMPPGMPLSPYHTPPGGMPVVGAAPLLNYAGQPVPPAPSAKASPTPSGLLNAFRRRWVLGTFVGLLAAAIAGMAVWVAMPAGKHEARGLINLRDRNTDVITFKSNEDYESYRRNQIFILKTRDLLTRVVGDPSVGSLTMFKGVEDRERMIEESLMVSAAAPSILTVGLKGDNIEEMRIVIDALMKRYVEDATATDRKDRADQIKKLAELERTLKDEAEAVERQIRLIAGNTGATGGESQEVRLAGLQRRVSELDADVNQINRELGRAESERKIARQQVAEGRPPIDVNLLKIAVDNDLGVRKLIAERKRLDAILQKTIENATNPATDSTVKDSQEILAKADGALANLKKTVQAEIEELENARGLSVLRKQIGELDIKILANTDLRDKQTFDRDTLQKTVASGAEGNFNVSALLQGLIPQREAIAKIRTQQVAIRVQSNLDNATNIRELAQAFPNTNLTKKVILAGGAGFGTFAIVVLLIAFLEWRTRRIDGVDQVVDELGMRIIGTVPAFPNRASLAAATQTGGANWRFALNEAINSTRTMLLHAARGQSMQVVMVTSATQGEGKTSLTSQLGSSMATAGMRTLIVDCDLRNPSIHKLFDLTLTNGVSEILTQDVDVADAIQPTAIPNLWVIPAGQCSNRVIAALAQGSSLETLFNRLRGQFDFVIVDSCPVLPVADALLIAQHVDGVVFSIMQDISLLPKVLLASEKLNQLNIPMLGAVVNGIKQDVYSYGYNYVKQLPA